REWGHGSTTICTMHELAVGAEPLRGARATRFLSVTDVVCLAILLAYLLWLPMPFGTVTDTSQSLLIVPPLVLCAAAASIRAVVLRKHPRSVPLNLPYTAWTAGSLSLVVVVLLQVIPLPHALLRIVSP